MRTRVRSAPTDEFLGNAERFEHDGQEGDAPLPDLLEQRLDSSHLMSPTLLVTTKIVSSAVCARPFGCRFPVTVKSQPSIGSTSPAVADWSAQELQ
jgi:hypothetical protein